MKKLVCSAIALSLTSATGLASDDGWSSLDEQVEALTSSLSSAQGGGPEISGRVRIIYENSGDIQVAPTGNDLGGFAIEDARVKLTGSRGDYSYTVQTDLADNGGGSALLDAFTDFPVGGTVNARVGQFKPGVLRSGLVSSGKLFFVDRTANGGGWGTRRQGFMLSGDFDQIGWWLTIQDGSDGDGDELFAALRVAFDFLGEGIDDSANEGSYGGTEDPTGTVAIAFFDDGELSDGDGTAVEAYVATNTYSFGFDLVDYGKDGYTAAIEGGSGLGDSTPFSAFGTYMFSPQTWEGGLRYSDFDNDEDTTKIDVAVNRYLDGHNLKWTLQYSMVDNKDLPDVDIIALQLQVGF
jgi:hypothetical protein